MKLSIIIVISCDLFIVLLVPCFSLLKVENGLKNHVRNVAYIKYGSVSLVLIFIVGFAVEEKYM